MSANKASIVKIIFPVLEKLDDSMLKQHLLMHFGQQSSSFENIEKCFQKLTSQYYNPEQLRYFFHSWSMTNNSAMTVSGLSNRLSMLAYKNLSGIKRHQLLKAIAHLNRITDEDLAAVGNIIHSELFYLMATYFCQGDEWMSRKYLTSSAKLFKRWKDNNSLNNEDLVIGLLTTVVHEIYTHGEVEYILPLFNYLLENRKGIEIKKDKSVLNWIIVHTGSTEKDHFYHAIKAVEHFTKAIDANLNNYELGEIIERYMQLKAKVMISIINEIESHKLEFSA